MRVYSAEGHWPKGNSVVPDIEILNDPEALARGHDQQLDAAISYEEQAIKQVQKVSTPEGDNGHG